MEQRIFDGSGPWDYSGERLMEKWREWVYNAERETVRGKG